MRRDQRVNKTINDLMEDREEIVDVKVQENTPEPQIITPDKPLSHRRTLWWAILAVIPQIPPLIDQYLFLVPSKYQKYANFISAVCLAIAGLYARQTAVDRTK